MSGHIVVGLLDRYFRTINKPLTIIETGCAREIPRECAASEERSTVLIAEWIRRSSVPHTFHSIDSSPESIACAKQLLRRRGLESYANLHRGDSAQVLSSFQFPIDFAFLDSDTDPGIILDEFRLVYRQMLARGGMIVIDDVCKQNIGVNKGAKAIPEADDYHLAHATIERAVEAIAVAGAAWDALASFKAGFWNGHRAAVSLTFDDGLPVQLDYAIPEMELRGIKGTFFLIAGQAQSGSIDLSRWRDVLVRGHEIGSHSVDHLKVGEISEQAIEAELGVSRDILERVFETKIVSYAHPFTHVNACSKEFARQKYLQARGGRVANKDKFIEPGRTDFSFFDFPCWHVGSSVFVNGELDAWLQEAYDRGAWLTLMLHGVGPDQSQWDNVSSEQFRELLDRLRDRDFWIAPFGAVADLFRRKQ